MVKPESARSLDALLTPRSIALVGASERSPWSQMIARNFALLGYEGAVSGVNRMGITAHGYPGYTSLCDIPETPDLAYIFVPKDSVAEALEDAIAAGVPAAAILTSGFGETGDSGKAEQQGLVDRARAAGMVLLGPNCLGLANLRAKAPVTPIWLTENMPKGGVAVISQSGATAAVMTGYAVQQGVGLSAVVATGNEADVTAIDIIEYLLASDDTRVITLFAETINDPDAFRRVARIAQETGKALVVLKVGTSALASQLAVAHTGSVTGDDRIFDAICRQTGVIRCHSIEETIITAGLLDRVGRVKRHVGILSISGGACEIIADRAEAVGLELPEFSAQTAAAINELIPGFGPVYNPLDITGAAIRDPSLFEEALKIIADDPAIGLTACVYDLPSNEFELLAEDTIKAIARGLAANDPPGLIVNQATKPVGAFTREVMARCGIVSITGGLHFAIGAMAALGRWSRHPQAAPDAAAARTTTPATARPVTERETLAFLAEAGVPSVPTRLARTAEEAVAHAAEFDGEVVVKVSSEQIKHKSDVGGVKLRLAGDVAVAEAFEAIMASTVAACPDAEIEGCIVMPMRSGGVEMFVGVTCNSAWGPVIVVGLGGVWIELLSDTSLRALPITPDDAKAMLRELRGAKILDGYRGSPPADIDALAQVICRIGDAAVQLGPDLHALEINPLLVDGDRIEAVDALPIWNTGDHHD